MTMEHKKTESKKTPNPFFLWKKDNLSEIKKKYPDATSREQSKFAGYHWRTSADQEPYYKKYMQLERKREAAIEQETASFSTVEAPTQKEIRKSPKKMFPAQPSSPHSTSAPSTIMRRIGPSSTISTSGVAEPAQHSSDQDNADTINFLSHFSCVRRRRRNESYETMETKTDAIGRLSDSFNAAPPQRKKFRNSLPSQGKTSYLPLGCDVSLYDGSSTLPSAPIVPETEGNIVYFPQDPNATCPAPGSVKLLPLPAEMSDIYQEQGTAKVLPSGIGNSTPTRFVNPGINQEAGTMTDSNSQIINVLPGSRPIAETTHSERLVCSSTTITTTFGNDCLDENNTIVQASEQDTADLNTRTVNVQPPQAGIAQQVSPNTPIQISPNQPTQPTHPENLDYNDSMALAGCSDSKFDANNIVDSDMDDMDLGVELPQRANNSLTVHGKPLAYSTEQTEHSDIPEKYHDISIVPSSVTLQTHDTSDKSHVMLEQKPPDTVCLHDTLPESDSSTSHSPDGSHQNAELTNDSTSKNFDFPVKFMFVNDFPMFTKLDPSD